MCKFLLGLGLVCWIPSLCGSRSVHKQSSDTQATYTNSAYNRRVNAMSPKQKKSTERGPKHKMNLRTRHRTYIIYTNRAQTQQSLSRALGAQHFGGIKKHKCGRFLWPRVPLPRGPGGTKPLRNKKQTNKHVWGTPVAQFSVTQGSRVYKTLEK